MKPDMGYHPRENMDIYKHVVLIGMYGYHHDDLLRSL